MRFFLVASVSVAVFARSECSCSDCDGLRARKEGGPLECAARDVDDTTCASYCSDECVAQVPEDHAEMTKRLPCVHRTKQPVLNNQQLAVIQTMTEACPVEQPCNCWCKCPETVYGDPVPPGIPPLPAANPFAPPPPLPKAPPPPFGGVPPPAVGVPFNPNYAQAMIQEDQPNRACMGPECHVKSGCPDTMPCNCYCACRPPVPPKSFLQQVKAPVAPAMTAR